jgi:hypothetical protein
VDAGMLCAITRGAAMNNTRKIVEIRNMTVRS